MSMGAENAPFSCAKTLQHSPTLQGAKLGICIHRSHENGRMLIVLPLFGSQAADIDIDIAGKDNIVGIIDENCLAGKMTALSFIDLKMQFTKVEESIYWLLNMHRYDRASWSHMSFSLAFPQAVVSEIYHGKRQKSTVRKHKDPDKFSPGLVAFECITEDVQ